MKAHPAATAATAAATSFPPDGAARQTATPTAGADGPGGQPGQRGVTGALDGGPAADPAGDQHQRDGDGGLADGVPHRQRGRHQVRRHQLHQHDIQPRS